MQNLILRDTILIDPNAIIHPGAKIAADVQIGPWTIIGDEVEIVGIKPTSKTTGSGVSQKR